MVYLAADRHPRREVVLDDPPNSGRHRVEQIKRDCLNALYSRDYYKVYLDTYSKILGRFDLGIFITSGVTGASGLAILKDNKFGVICGVLTVASLFLNGAKRHFRIQDKINFASERLQFFEGHYFDLQTLVDDLNAERKWTKGFNDRYVRVRSKQGLTKVDRFSELNIKTRQNIQDAIKRRIDYQSWWSP